MRRLVGLAALALPLVLVACGTAEGEVVPETVTVTRTLTTTKSTTSVITTTVTEIEEPSAEAAAEPGTQDLDTQTAGLGVGGAGSDNSGVEVRPQGFAAIPDPAPELVPAPAPDSVPTSFANCSAVRAAGAAPLYAGSPGYSKKLDRDGDGVACE